MTLSSRFAQASLMMLFVAAPALAAAQPVDAPAQPPAQAQQPDYHPTIADLMNIAIQSRHTKIGMALHESNWTYLNYEAKELNNALARVARTTPRTDGKDVAQLMDATIAQPMRDLMDAVKAKDIDKSRAAYAAVTTSCNACHQAVSHPWIVIKPPQGDAYPDQDFGVPGQ